MYPLHLKYHKEKEVRTLGKHVSTTPEIPFMSNMGNMHVVCQ
jgi:hypothetical protein